MRHLTPPPAWTALAAGMLGCAGILLFAAPDIIDRTRISLLGGGSDTVMTLEAAVARHNTSPALTAAVQEDGVVIAERRSGSLLATHDFAGQVLADQAVEDMRQAATATVASVPAPASTGVSTLLVAQREGVQSEISSADQSQEQISASLSEIMRDIADLQRAAATPPVETGDDPTKAMLAQLQMRRIELAAKYTEAFPGIAATDGEIDQLKALTLQQRPMRQAVNIGQALGTLRAEQRRLEDAEAATAARRVTLVARRDGLDTMLAANLASPPQQVAAAATPPGYQIMDGGSTTLPDPRPMLYAAVLVTSLVAAAGLVRLRRRRALGPFALHVRRIEQSLKLPVLRCLNVTSAEPRVLESPKTPETLLIRREVA